MYDDQMRITLAGVTIAALFAVGCGPDETVEPKGSICEPEPSVDPKDCYLEPVRDRNSVLIDTEEDVRRVCNSPCTKVRSLLVNDVPGLEDLGAFGRIEQVDDTLHVRNNSQLKSLDGLGVEGKLETIKITGNSVLTSIEGLSGVTEVGFKVTVSGNGELRSLGGLESLEAIKGRGEVAGVDLKDNQLRTLDGLENLSIDEGHIKIVREPELRDLEGLGEVGTFDWIEVRDCSSFRSFAGGGGVKELTDSLYVTGNSKLPTCLAEQFSERVAQDAHGEIRILNNGGYDFPACEGSGN